MKNKNLFQKIAFPSLIGVILLFSAVPAIFSQSAMPAPKQEKLLNGLKVLMWSDAKADKVTVKIRINSGSAFDPQGKEGVMQLLADNLFPNQASRDFFAEDLGGGLDIVTNYDYIQINASSKPEGFLTMLETLATAVSNTAIDKETTLKLRNALLAKLKIKESDPAYVADQAVAKRLLGTFPYGRPQMGSTASVQKIDFADLIDAKQRFLTADNAAIAISGNYDKALGFKAVRRYFGGWLKADKRVPPTFRQPDEPDLKMIDISMADAARAEVRFAFRGISRSDKDFPASRIFTCILRERFSNLMGGNDFEQFSVANNAHVLPGYFALGYSAKAAIVPLPSNHQASADAPAYVRSNPILSLFRNITDAEFAKATAAFLAENSKKSVEDQWLDGDTYKIVPADEAKALQNITIADVQRIAERLAKNPVAVVTVSNQK